MCWFGARWNVQRNVTCIVICTIPWTNRYVNTYRDVWAHPAHVCFSDKCSNSHSATRTLCYVCQYDAGIKPMHDNCRLLVHVVLDITLLSSQVNSKCAVSKRMSIVHWLLYSLCTCDRNCVRNYRALCIHEAMLAHPPNLSILVSGGVHTTLYVFSHCERTRIISQLQSFACALNCCTHTYCQFWCGCNLLATPIQWGWQPRMEPAHIYLRFTQHD